MPQKSLFVRGTALLENPYRLPCLPVLRLEERVRQPVHLPRSRGLRLLTKQTLLGVLLTAVGLGALIGTFTRGPEGIGWIFALLVLSAAVTAIAQQTLP